MLGGYYLGEQVLGGGAPAISITGGSVLVHGTGLIVVTGGIQTTFGGTVAVVAVGVITVNNTNTYFSNYPVARVPFTVAR